MAIHCPECSFINSESANYCQKCGAYLAVIDSSGDSTTAIYRVDESGDLKPVEIEEVVAPGAALVIRGGGGRAGESFSLSGELMTVGRQPDSDIFLDDVTVSRNHALIVKRTDHYYIDDCGP